MPFVRKTPYFCREQVAGTAGVPLSVKPFAMILKHRFLFLCLSALLLLPVRLPAADGLTLERCRTLALEADRTLQMARLGAEKSRNERRAAHTAYLPKVQLTAAYLHTGNEIKLLSSAQQAALGSLGTNLAPALAEAAEAVVQQHPELAPLVQQLGQSMEPALNGAGRQVADAFRTDTRNLYTGALILTQPLYMGGKIRAYNQMARAAEEAAGLALTARQQDVLLGVDQAYWQVVALAGKQRLAQAYLEMLQAFESDVRKMVEQGMATRADELSISVQTNEAEVTLTSVTDGLRLARMLLCQRCGLPLTDSLITADEQCDSLPEASASPSPDVTMALARRTEIRQLEKGVEVADQRIRLQRSDYLPHLALTGGYLLSNPSLFNGFQTRFRGTWSVGVTLSMPILTWNEHKYKLNAARAEAAMTRLQLAEARSQIELQVNQAAIESRQARKQLGLAEKNVSKAQENLRMARVAFQEEAGTTSNVLAAHTAWLKARNQQIDAQIGIRLADTNLQKVLGLLAP